MTEEQFVPHPAAEVIPVEAPFVEVPVLRTYTELSTLLYNVQERHGYICGGIVRWMCSPKYEPVPASDIDIYAVDQTHYLELKSYIENDLNASEYHENRMAHTYRQREGSVLPRLQLIKPVEEGRVVSTGNFEDILRNFDFTVVRIGLMNDYVALADPMWRDDELNKRIRLRNIHCPISSTSRILKYTKKGYWCPPSEILRLFEDWDNRGDDYKANIIELFMRSLSGEITEEEVDVLENLMRID